MTGRSPDEPRCAAIVGTYLSGKTTLLESLLHAAGGLARRGTVGDGNTVGDAAPEARARGMSTEVGCASASYLGESWTFLDCPGSIELAQEARNALMVADVAVVVCEPLPDRAVTLAPLFRFLDLHAIPHMVFVNKMDAATARVAEVMQALQHVSDRPLVLRQVPIRAGAGTPDSEPVTGYVDLVSERAYRYRAGEASDLVPIPDTVRDREQAARQELLEALADFDDGLLEQLLEDAVPEKTEIYRHLADNVAADRIVPVFLGSAERLGGVQRLLKALRHEAPGPAETARRLGLDPDQGEPVLEVAKTLHLPHSGKISISRIWRGRVTDGITLNGERLGALTLLNGHQQAKIAEAGRGAVVALPRMEGLRTGDAVTPSGARPEGLRPWPAPLPPVYAAALSAERRADEVKLTAALAKLCEEDPSLGFEQRAETNELLLLGQGDIHLQVAADRLRGRFNVAVTTGQPRIPYTETIRRPTRQHARFKRQSGGHGQFGDVHVDIAPLPRGSGFAFTETVVGGAVPRNYIPAVEEGVRDFLKRGPLGFPMVDIAVNLADGTYHSVDSSDQAFRTAARMAMAEGTPKCDPVLLEPIHEVRIATPSEFLSAVQRVISGRRGQILGFDARPGWPGWDEVVAHLPLAEMHDLIIELRSLTLGVATYRSAFHHSAELTGRLAEKVVAERQAAQ